MTDPDAILTQGRGFFLFPRSFTSPLTVISWPLFLELWQQRDVTQHVTPDAPLAPTRHSRIAKAPSQQHRAIGDCYVSVPVDIALNMPRRGGLNGVAFSSTSGPVSQWQPRRDRRWYWACYWRTGLTSGQTTITDNVNVQQWRLSPLWLDKHFSRVSRNNEMQLYRIFPHSLSSLYRVCTIQDKLGRGYMRSVFVSNGPLRSFALEHYRTSIPVWVRKVHRKAT